MASFIVGRLISLLLISLLLSQLISLISSTTLTLKSSHSHLNLNRILNSNFDRSEVCLSFKYKPLNQRFSLISGIIILDLQSNGSELNEPLKFVLIVNLDDRLELIVTRVNKASRENWLGSYFLEVNRTRMIPREQVDSWRYGEDAGSCIVLENKEEQIRESLTDDPVGLVESQERPAKVDHEKVDNWRLLGVQISRDRLQIVHTSYASCLLNGRNQSNCRQRILTYRLRTKNELPDDQTDYSTNGNIQSNRDDQTTGDKQSEINKEQRSSEFIELSQLLIGKEWSESDSFLINPGNRSMNAAGPSDLKQLNETEDQHSKSQIHNNFVQSSIPNFQTSNQEFSGLIGCLNAIELNGHYLAFSLDDAQADERSEANEPHRIDSGETSDQVHVGIDKKIKDHRQAAFGTMKVPENDRRRSGKGPNIAGDPRTNLNVADDVQILANTSFAADREQIEFEEGPPVSHPTDWWTVHRSHDVLVGKIELNVCNQSDPCANYCLHNAACMLNEDDGQPICHCDLVGYTGERCFFRKFF